LNAFIFLKIYSRKFEIFELFRKMKKIFIDKIKTNSDDKGSSRQFKRRKLYKSIKSVKLKKIKFSKKKENF